MFIRKRCVAYTSLTLHKADQSSPSMKASPCLIDTLPTVSEKEDTALWWSAHAYHPVITTRVAYTVHTPHKALQSSPIRNAIPGLLNAVPTQSEK